MRESQEVGRRVGGSKMREEMIKKSWKSQEEWAKWKKRLEIRLNNERQKLGWSSERGVNWNMLGVSRDGPCQMKDNARDMRNERDKGQKMRV